jgi:hypothetical protein
VFLPTVRVRPRISWSIGRGATSLGGAEGALRGDARCGEVAAMLKGEGMADDALGQQGGDALGQGARPRPTAESRLEGGE